VPSEPVTLRRRAHNGVTTERQAPGGAVFHPLPEKGIVTPIWFYGPKTKPTVFFTCPVSAIPIEVRELFVLWIACRHMKALPLAGGVLDQPAIVQEAFPLFEVAARVVTATPAGEQADTH
jgi:hypothetical protein